jgi:tetratricopeptide (TPR) repeat protein
LLATVLGAAAWAVADGPEEALMEGGHWKRVRAIAEERFKTNPNDAYANYLMGRARLAFGDVEAALKHAEKAATLDAKNADYRYLLAAAVGEKAESAGIFSQMGLAKRFKREAEATIALDPKHIDARFALMVFHLKAPGLVGGDKKKTQVLLDEIRRLNPARGYLAEIRMAREEKRTVNLEALYQKAIEADPKIYSPHIALADIYASDQHKKYEQGEKLARTAMRIAPDRMAAYAYLAALYSLQERWADLDAILADAEKNVPDNLYAFYQSGRVLLQGGKDLPRAERYLRKYLTQPPEVGMPPHAAAHWRLGLILEKQGRAAEALAALQTSVRLDPKFEPAKNDLKRLKAR